MKQNLLPVDYYDSVAAAAVVVPGVCGSFPSALLAFCESGHFA